MKKELKTSASKIIHNLIILDESGSMTYIEKPALSGANETIQTIKSAQESNPDQKQFLTFVSFSLTGEEEKCFRILIDNKPAEEVRELADEDYNPRGCTPLWDAMGHSLTRLEKAVKDDDLVNVTIITDGYENASREYNGKSIKALVERLKAKGWLFAYIGANQDAIEVARSMSIDNAMNYSADEEDVKRMWRKERKSRQRYYSRINDGVDAFEIMKDYFEED